MPLFGNEEMVDAPQYNQPVCDHDRVASLVRSAVGVRTLGSYDSIYCCNWLVIEAGVGIAVLVNCFVHKHDMNRQIKDRLGDGFSRAPFATLVAVFSAVSLLACLPLGKLFFFHMILIRKYVVAMRAMSEAHGGASVDEMPTLQDSLPWSATTGLSGGRKFTGLQYKGARCTPTPSRTEWIAAASGVVAGCLRAAANGVGAGCLCCCWCRSLPCLLPSGVDLCPGACCRRSLVSTCFIDLLVPAAAGVAASALGV
ncbi:hypothetical protein IFM89_010727 [Coptis chinensis]|uniref:S-acyltransferase n=1 Tax=Coptis chinensis TaxID=261450 RepID=A0A835M8A4_9MAGN|nr:hypothetical protein IFM89_010727 [Coptis chinensis]